MRHRPKELCPSAARHRDSTAQADCWSKQLPREREEMDAMFWSSGSMRAIRQVAAKKHGELANLIERKDEQDVVFHDFGFWRFFISVWMALEVAAY